jgi:MYXO-CTERM domain-containing protein
MPARAKFLAVLMALGVSATAQAAELLLAPSQDNSIYTGNGLETRSDGQGDYLWLSVTAGGVNRRSLIRFDTTAIPPGAVVTEVTLSLYESRARDAHVVTVHRLLRSWGEGASNGGGQGEGAPAAPGDATWLHAFFPNVFWAQPGGDHVAAPSASASVGFAGEFYSWGPSAGLRNDVQAWVNAPASNHGWILIGQESGLQNAKRFESGNNAVVVNRPRLRVVYDLPVQGDVPLPAWMLAALALGLGWRMRRRPSPP